MKKILVSLLCFIGATLLTTSITFAEESGSSSEVNIKIQAMNDITSTTNSVSLVGSTLYSSSATRSGYAPDTIGLRIYLQRRQSSWINTGQSKEYTASNTSSISRSTSFSLQDGYRYRVKIVHFVKDNGAYDSEITYSNTIDLR